MSDQSLPERGRGNGKFGSKISRRQLLRSSGVGAVSGLAGCGGDGGATPTATDSGTATSSATQSATASATATETASPTATETETPVGEFARTAQGKIIAEPGQIQAALDKAAEERKAAGPEEWGGAEVVLRNGVLYELQQPTEIPSRVTLNCAGAEIMTKFQLDPMFLLHPRSQIREPMLHPHFGKTFKETVFRVDTGEVGSVGRWNGNNHWMIFGGRTIMFPREGTWLEIRSNQEPAWSINVHHEILHGDTAVRLRHEGASIANCYFDCGIYGKWNTAIKHEGINPNPRMIHDNTYHIGAHPDKEADWIWDNELGQMNVLKERASLGNFDIFSDANGDGTGEIWHLGQNTSHNFFQTRKPGDLSDRVQNESSGTGNQWISYSDIGTPV